jgi:hypothetical protein
LKMRARIAISCSPHAAHQDSTPNRPRPHSTSASRVQSSSDAAPILAAKIAICSSWSTEIASNHDFDSKRQVRHVATSERPHETIKRSTPAPAIVIFACHAIQTKSTCETAARFA